MLLSERTGLQVRRARLDAELDGTDSIAFPASVQSQVEDPDVQRAIRQEQMLFDAHRDALASQVAALAASRELFATEVTSLDAKDASLTHQLDVTQKQLAQISTLVAKGYAALPRQLEAEQSAASFQSAKLDVQLAGLRTRQEISKAQRDEIDLKASRRTEALKESAEVHTRLVALAERIETSRRLLDQTMDRAAAISGDAEDLRRRPTYWVTRRVGGAPSRHMKVDENDAVEPGDTVEVQMRSETARAAAERPRPEAADLSGRAAPAAP